MVIYVWACVWCGWRLVRGCVWWIRENVIFVNSSCVRASSRMAKSSVKDRRQSLPFLDSGNEKGSRTIVLKTLLAQIGDEESG